MMMWSTRWLKLAVPALLVGSAAYSIAQVPSGLPFRADAEAPASTDDPAETIRRIQKEWGDAILEKDAETVAPFLADDFVGTDRQGNVFDKATYLADLRKGFGTVQIAFPEIKVRVYGDTAGVNGIVHYEKVSEDLILEAEDRFTSTFLKQRGRWRCVVNQASPYRDIQSATLRPAPDLQIPKRATPR